MEITSWAVHPSWERPRLIPASFRGVEERDLSSWFLQLPDAEQDKLLKTEWEDVCDWAAQRDPDVVMVSGFPEEFEGMLAGAGFVPEVFGARIFEWAYRGTSEQIREVMKALHEVPSIDIRVDSGGLPLVHVLDQSWDFVILYSASEPAYRSHNLPESFRQNES